MAHIEKIIQCWLQATDQREQNSLRKLCFLFTAYKYIEKFYRKKRIWDVIKLLPRHVLFHFHIFMHIDWSIILPIHWIKKTGNFTTMVTADVLTEVFVTARQLKKSWADAFSGLWRGIIVVHFADLSLNVERMRDQAVSRQYNSKYD